MPPASIRLTPIPVLVLACFACGDDGQGATGASKPTITVGDEQGNESEPTTTIATEPGGSATMASDGSSSTGEPAPFVPYPVRGGLEIDWIEANQGGGVAIGRDGEGIGGGDRTSYLIQNRVTLIRAFWKPLPSDWTPRKIEGWLTVIFPDGTELVQSSKPMVDQESFIGSLERSFFWGLMADQTVPGIKFHVELYEVEPGHEDLPEGANPPRLPYTGEAPVGIEKSDQVMKVTLVPFNYHFGDCNTSPDVSDETMQLFQNQMYMMNPLDRLEFTLHEPIDWNTELTDFNQTNEFMSGLRADEGAEPERYYFGLIDACSGGVGGAGGKAFGIPQGGKKSDAYMRVSSGLSIKDDAWSSETFVHEVGHSQGRYHVACSGEEGGPDNTYPWPKGEIHDWGFGVLNFELYHPTVNKDYMTYCHPVWASSWGWNKVYPIIKTLSTWDDAGAPAPNDPELGSVLVGSLYPDGTNTWITVPGGVNPDQISAVHSVEFEIAGKTVQQPAAYLPQPEGEVVLLVTELPERWDEVTKITRVAGPRRFAVDRPAISEHHRPRALKPAH